MTDRMVAEVFPPGIFIKEELDARGWTQDDLVQILGRSSYSRLISEVINGKRAITPETAAALGEAFGTGAEYWMNLQTAFQLAKTKPEPEGGIARRAQLYAKAPIKHMLRRRWIEGSSNLDVLERRVLDFYNITHLEEDPKVWMAARTGTAYYEALTSEQLAWLMRAKKLARAASAKPFTDEGLEAALPRLKLLVPQADNIGHLTRILADAGIRLVIVEHLPGTRVDGACIWLDERSPVIALSLRFDRIDHVWHTLMHEVKHVKNRDGLLQNAPLDIDLLKEHDVDGPSPDRPPHEIEADQYAANFLIPYQEMDGFIVRCRPLYPTRQIIGFAACMGVHPGIVVGQLQFRKEIPYRQGRSLLAPVRELMTKAASTDGWGCVPARNS